MPAPYSPNTQVVGNIGLYYVCYHLSRLGWNVMTTARNAKGIDIIIYSQDAERKFAVQVKALSKSSPVPLGGKLSNLFGDFLVICRKLETTSPECFILTPDEVKKLAHEGKSPKDDKLSYWLQPKEYDKDTFREMWGRIGHGSQSGMTAVNGDA